VEEEGGRRRRTPVAPVAVVASGEGPVIYSLIFVKFEGFLKKIT